MSVCPCPCVSCVTNGKFQEAEMAIASDGKKGKGDGRRAAGKGKTTAEANVKLCAK